METLLVRLKPYDPQRKFVLRRYAYRGLHFLVKEGWKRVPKDVGDYLRAVRQKEFDTLSPPAFDVCTDAEAQAIDAHERRVATERRTAVEAIHTSLPRYGDGSEPTDAAASAEADDGPSNEARRARRGGRSA